MYINPHCIEVTFVMNNLLLFCRYNLAGEENYVYSVNYGVGVWALCRLCTQ